MTDARHVFGRTDCRLTPLWCPRCPICNGVGERDPGRLVLDCECLHCGHSYTSSKARSLLAALTREQVQS